MAEYLIQGETLNQIADAIRAKTGEEGEMTPVEMSEKIESIEGVWEKMQKGTLTEWVDDEIVELTAPLFINYPSLTKISCNALTSIPSFTFLNSTNLTDIYLPNLKKLEDFGALYKSGGHFEGCGSLNTIYLPELISAKGQMNFSDCDNLIAINFPKLQNLTYSMFFSCKKLMQVKLPSVTTIDGNGPFSHCQSLVKLQLPSLVQLKNCLTYNCKALETIDFSALIEISYYSQIFDSCPMLKALILRNESAAVTLSSSSAFNSKDGIGAGTGYIYVPAALIEEYKSATNWSTYATQFRALEDYTVDGTITGELDETKIAEAAE